MGHNHSQLLTDEENALKIINENKVSIKWHTTKFIETYDTPLLYACEMKYEKLACRIIDKYIELEAKQAELLSGKKDAVAGAGSSNKKIKVRNYMKLLGHVAQNGNQTGFTPLIEACKYGLVSVILKLMQYPEHSNIDYKVPENYYGLYNGTNALVIFLMNIHLYDRLGVDVFSHLLEANKKNINASIKSSSNNYYENILTYYCTYSTKLSTKIINTIINLGVDINYQNELGNTFLMIIVRNFGNIENTITKILEENSLHTKYNWGLVNKNKMDVIMLVATYNTHETYKLFSDYYNKYSIKKPLAKLFDLAYRNKNINIIKDMIKEGYELSQAEYHTIQKILSCGS